MIATNDLVFPNDQSWSGSLTKRELFAALAMQGICAHQDLGAGTLVKIAEVAVAQADALIEALNSEDSAA